MNKIQIKHELLIGDITGAEACKKLEQLSMFRSESIELVKEWLRWRQENAPVKYKIVVRRENVDETTRGYAVKLRGKTYHFDKNVCSRIHRVSNDHFHLPRWYAISHDLWNTNIGEQR